MRQVGILCAAALVALQDIVGELESDHKKARTLADGLNQIKGLRVDTSSVETNIVYIEIKEGSGTTAAKLSKDLENYGVLLMPLGSSKIRVVFHHQISDSDVQYALSCFQQAVNGVGNENGN
uniref:Aromatic amino acid beta-eliminating lyase/threonine aldolase domain-containing protein n=4 Tax=cellular organisms TaxID=131567 RepID=I3SQG9_LOTJA|nr:unknown [Lotus japonicus]